MRTRSLVAVAMMIGVAAGCRDILGIAGSTTIADGSVLTDGAPLVDVNADGTTTTLCGALTKLADSGQVTSIVADSNGVYWSELADGTSGNIWAFENGTAQEVADHTETPINVAIDATNLYWIGWVEQQNPSPTIRVWPRHTTNTSPTDFPLSGVTGGRIAVDGTTLYFGDWQSGDGGLYSLSTSSLSSAPTLLAKNLDSVFHVVVDSRTLYFDEHAGANREGTSISSLDLDDGGIHAIDTQTIVDGIASGSGHTYWAGGSLNKVFQVGGPNLLLSQAVDLTLDPAGTYVYAVSTPSNDILVRLATQNGNQTGCASFYEVGAIYAIAGHVYIGAAFEQDVWAVWDLVPN